MAAASARADLAALRAQLASWQEQPALQGVLMVSEGALAACTATVDAALQRMDAAQPPQPEHQRQAGEEGAGGVLNPVADAGRGERGAGASFEVEAAAAELAPADARALRTMRRSTQPAVVVRPPKCTEFSAELYTVCIRCTSLAPIVWQVVAVAFCLAAAYYCARMLPLVHPRLEAAAWSFACFFAAAGAIAAFVLTRMGAQLRAAGPASVRAMSAADAIPRVHY
jgi:hypothetical protein